MSLPIPSNFFFPFCVSPKLIFLKLNLFINCRHKNKKIAIPIQHVFFYSYGVKNTVFFLETFFLRNKLALRLCRARDILSKLHCLNSKFNKIITKLEINFSKFKFQMCNFSTPSRSKKKFSSVSLSFLHSEQSQLYVPKPSLYAHMALAQPHLLHSRGAQQNTHGGLKTLQ